MIIVTGGAGLIGSNLIEQLNLRGHTDILAVDHLKNGHKMHNLADLHIRDYLDRDDFMSAPCSIWVPVLPPPNGTGSS